MGGVFAIEDERHRAQDPPTLATTTVASPPEPVPSEAEYFKKLLARRLHAKTKRQR